MLLEEIKRNVISSFKPFNPNRIIIFGSATRADWDEFSDVDVIVVYETRKRFLDRLKELYLSWNIPKTVDILAYTPDEFAAMSQHNHFIKEILTTGEIIYERESKRGEPLVLTS